MCLLQAQKLVQYLRECEDALDWISDKVRFTLTMLKTLPEVYGYFEQGANLFSIQSTWLEMTIYSNVVNERQ